jgi:hypothetical protein
MGSLGSMGVQGREKGCRRSGPRVLLLGTRRGPALSSCKSMGRHCRIILQGHRDTFFSGRFQISGDRGTQLLRAISPDREDHSP